MKIGKRQITEGIEPLNQERIGTFWEKETYKYLGILEADTSNKRDVKKAEKD